jgi:hypothetical protein
MNNHFFNKTFLGMLLATLLLPGSLAQATPADAPSPSPAENREEDARSPQHPFGLVELPRQAPVPPAGRPPPRPSENEGPPPLPPGPPDLKVAQVSEGDDRRGSRRGAIENANDMAMLDRLLAMPPEQLVRVRQALERIEAMTPEEREVLRERLRAFGEIAPEKRKEIREEWREMSPEERREHIRAMRERRWEGLLEEKAESEKTPPD